MPIICICQIKPYICAQNNVIMIKISAVNVSYVVECRNDSLGKKCYHIHCARGVFRFRHMDSLLDFINMNEFGCIANDND